MTLASRARYFFETELVEHSIFHWISVVPRAPPGLAEPMLLVQTPRGLVRFTHLQPNRSSSLVPDAAQQFVQQPTPNTAPEALFRDYHVLNLPITGDGFRTDKS